MSGTTFTRVIRNERYRAILLLVPAGLSLGTSFFHLGGLPFDAAWIAIVLCGIPILKEAGIGLFTRFDIRADVLVSLALIASVLTDEIFAAGEVAFIMRIGSFLEETTVARARAGIEKLVRLTPRTARRLTGGREETVPAEQIRPGDLLRVLPGETIPVDGVIVQGETSVDQSVVTGESLPADKQQGDEVFSGTVNRFGAFEMRALREDADSSIQRIVRLVQSADAGKARIVGLADRWATWIVVIALVSAGGVWWLTGEIIRAVTILVVFCPCALVLATPTAIMAAIGNATRRGILIRQGDALERLPAERPGWRRCATSTKVSPTTNCSGWRRPPNCVPNTRWEKPSWRDSGRNIPMPSSPPRTSLKWFRDGASPRGPKAAGCWREMKSCSAKAASNSPASRRKQPLPPPKEPR